MSAIISTFLPALPEAGLVIGIPPGVEGTQALAQLSQWLHRQIGAHAIDVLSGPSGQSAHVVQICQDIRMAAHATMMAPVSLKLTRDVLTREILVRLLDGPMPFHFPSLQEFHAHVEMRVAIVEAAARTELAFHTQEADRPRDMWTENEDGFAILPGVDLVTALKAATQPDSEGPRFAFSCYRASEYVILIGMAEVIKVHHPALYARLQGRCEQSLIKSRLFHDTFLFEYGQDSSLPRDYYIPGDRVWFRNPDERSADLAGYEGSWTIYLGGGQFANFWERHRPYTLIDKCVEIYHWRHGLNQDDRGEPCMDEARVAACCARSRRDPAEMAHILSVMMRPRDLGGSYGRGGCLDRTREYPRWILPGTANVPV